MDDGQWGLLMLQFGREARTQDRMRTNVITTVGCGVLAAVLLNAPEAFWWNRPVPDLYTNLSPSLSVFALLLGIGFPLVVPDPGWDRGFFSDACYAAGWLLAISMGLLLGPTAAGGVMLLFPFRVNRWDDRGTAWFWAPVPLLLGPGLIFMSAGTHTLTVSLFWSVLLPTALVACFGGAYILWKHGEP